jgi:predicted nucleic acid-binding protein
LTLGQAQEAFRLLERRRPLLADESGLLQSAFALMLRRELSLWDCLYLALAIERQCNLITADRRFYRSASKLYPFIELL